MRIAGVVVKAIQYSKPSTTEDVSGRIHFNSFKDGGR